MNRQTKQIPRHARASIRQAGERWRRFLAMTEAIEADQDEISVEDFADFYAHFRILVRLAVPFDAAFAEKVERINLANRFRDDDSDADAADELIDREDSDEDAADELIDREDSDEDNDNSDREPS